MKAKINIEELIGKKYGEMTILSFVTFKQYKRSREPIFRCECSCGKIKIMRLWGLKSSNSKSCGCLRRNKSIKNISKLCLTEKLKMYKYQAKQRNLEFGLSNDEFEKLIFSNCYYCNEPPSNTFRNSGKFASIKYNGIDRKFNTVGYIPNNCVPSCFMCNRIKTDIDIDKFFQHINKMKILNDCKNCES